MHSIAAANGVNFLGIWWKKSEVSKLALKWSLIWNDRIYAVTKYATRQKNISFDCVKNTAKASTSGGVKFIFYYF